MGHHTCFLVRSRNKFGMTVRLVSTNKIITFDDKEYSEEETAILYQQFFESLAKIKGVKIPKYTGKALACIK